MSLKKYRYYIIENIVRDLEVKFFQYYYVPSIFYFHFYESGFENKLTAAFNVLIDRISELSVKLIETCTS